MSVLGSPTPKNNAKYQDKVVESLHLVLQLKDVNCTASANQYISPDSMRQKPAIKAVGAPHAVGFRPHSGHHWTPEGRRNSDTTPFHTRPNPRSHSGNSMAATWCSPTSPPSHSGPKSGPKPRGYIPHPPTVTSMHSRGRTETRSVHNLPESARANPSHGHDIIRSSYHPSGKRDNSRSSQYHGTYRSSSQPPRFSEDFRLPDSRHPHFSQARSAAPPRGGVARKSSTDGSIHVMHAPPTSPTLVHQSDKQPLIIPLNNGRDGWVIVPPKGQRLQILNPTQHYGNLPTLKYLPL